MKLAVFVNTRSGGADASVGEILLNPEPLLHQLEHVATLQLGVFLRDGLLQLGEEALAAETAHTGLPMLLAAFPGPADQLLR